MNCTSRRTSRAGLLRGAVASAWLLAACAGATEPPGGEDADGRAGSVELPDAHDVPLGGPSDAPAEVQESDAADADSADAHAEPASLPLEPATGCEPALDPCAELPTDTTLRASYRKDSFLPKEVYDEYTDEPVDGGRVHVVGIAGASGAVTDVRIEGVSAEDLLAPPDPEIEWHHVWPDPAVAGEPLWVAFHSRDPAWDGRAEATLGVTVEGGATALDGTFPVERTPAPLTYVSWEAITRSNWMFRSVRRHLREGDVTGAAITDGEALVEAIRSPDAIVVPVVNLAVEESVDDLRCIESLFSEGRAPHWVFGEQRVDVEVAIPGDARVTEVFEVMLGLDTESVEPRLDAEGRTVTLPDVGLSNDAPVRLFVLAASSSVRTSVDEILARGR